MNEKNKPTTYQIQILALQGQVFTQYYVATGSDNQLLLDLQGNKLFDNVLKVDRINDDDSTETVYANDNLLHYLNLAKFDYYKSIDDEENIKKMEELLNE